MGSQEGDCCQSCCPPVERYGSPADKTRNCLFQVSQFTFLLTTTKNLFVCGHSVNSPADNKNKPPSESIALKS